LLGTPDPGRRHLPKVEITNCEPHANGSVTFARHVRAMKSRPRLNPAFTLIELLVVISIIAILAGIATPIYNNAIRTAKMNTAMQNARSIALALRLYADDNGGVFPTDKDLAGNPIVTSNDAFRSLIPAYCDNESIFAIAGSKAGPKADGRIGSPSEILTRGENHWAMVGGLSTTSNSTWPLIVDHTNGSGRYPTDETALGGTWRGTHAIVVRTDGSAHKVTLLGTGDTRYLPRHDDPSRNALDLTDYMGMNARLLEPAL
jgi:prepilin-type N-terminal cleavage/methylation domain-containing protein